MSDDPARRLAEHVCSTKFDALAAGTVTATRRDIMDTFGCLLGGSAAPGIAELARVLTRWGGREESSVILLGHRLPAHHAAILHGSMAHALDYDDTLDHGGSIHPGASVLAASLAAVALRGPTSGRDFILAVALGLDVACRVALASTVDRGWHRTAAMGVFGATAAAARLLDLTVDQTVNALGIAYSQAAGNRQCIVDGALTKRLQAGQAASTAIFSVVLAREGFTGARNVFAGKYGFLALYQPGGHDISALTEDLGRAFRGEALSFKPYPCGRPLHAAIDAAIALHGVVAPGDVEEIIVEADAATLQDQLDGAPHKRQPSHIVEAQFALPFLLAAAIRQGRLGIDEVGGFDDPAIQALAQRVVGNPAAGTGLRRIRVRARSGLVISQDLGIPLGSPSNPMSDAALAAKFRDCAAHAVRPLPLRTVDLLIERFARLEQEEDISDLIGLVD